MSEAPAGWLRRTVLTAAFPAVAAIPAVLLWAVWLPRLPDRIATHFGLSGQPDDFVATTAFPFVTVGIAVGVGVLFGGLSFFLRENPLGQRVIAITSGGIGALLLVANVLLLAAHLDVTDPATVRFSGWYFGGLAVAMVIGGVLGRLSTGKLPPIDVQQPAGPEPVVTPDNPASVRWGRTIISPVTLGIMLAFLPLVVTISIVTSGWILALFVPLYAIMAAFSRAEVVIDRDGLTIRLLAGWPRFHFPITEIQSARSREVKAIGDFGGWGWRFNRKASGLILRSGPALWIYRDGHAALAVTIPDAEEAAALLNGLRRSSRES